MSKDCPDEMKGIPLSTLLKTYHNIETWKVIYKYMHPLTKMQGERELRLAVSYLELDWLADESTPYCWTP
jgi:hypothetical protein